LCNSGADSSFAFCGNRPSLYNRGFTALLGRNAALARLWQPQDALRIEK
jgi:hypothetical protein